MPHHYEPDDDYRPLYGLEVTQVLIHSSSVEAPAGWEPRLNEEHDLYRWCAVDEAVALLYWPEAKDALRALAVGLGIA